MPKSQFIVILACFYSLLSYICTENHNILGIMSAIGEIIKSRRKEFGLTQASLAKLSKIGVNTLTQIERGEGNPTVKVLERVLRTLGMQLTATVIEL